MHPEDILLGSFVVDNFGALNDTVGAEIAGAGTRQQSADVGPFDQIGAAVAVDVLEVGSVRFILANPTRMGLDLAVTGRDSARLASNTCCSP
jgi:hypothetical protein